MKTRITRALFAAIVAVAGRAAVRLTAARAAACLTERGRGGRGIRVSLIAVGVAVFALSALPQAAQAQTLDLRIRCPGVTTNVITTCDRNSTTSGLQLWEGDTFDVTVSASEAITAGRLDAVVVTSEGSADITTAGTTDTVGSHTGIRYRLGLAAGQSHTETYTVTQDTHKEGAETVELVLRTASIDPGDSVAPTGWSVPGTGILRRNFTIEASDRRTINIVVDTTREPHTEGDSTARPRFYFVLASGSDSLTSPALSIDWSVSIESGQTASAADFSGGTLPSGTGYNIPTSISTTNSGSIAVQLNVADDSVIESAETYTFSITSTDRRVQSGETILGPAVTATIADNDGYTLNVLAPATDATEGSTPNARVQFVSDRGSGTLGAATTVTLTVTNDVPDGPPAHVFGGLTGTGRACQSDWMGAGADNCNTAGTTLYTTTCILPATLAHGMTHNCALSQIVDDMANERDENYRITLSFAGGTPTGVTIGDPAQDVITASDPIAVTLGPAPAAVTEGGSAVLRINFSAAAGVTKQPPDAPDGNFHITFEYPSGTLLNTGNIPFSAVATGYYDWTVTPASAADTTVEAHDVRTYILRGNRQFNFYTTIPANAADRMRTVTFNDDDALTWTVRARGFGARVSDVNEDATPLALATDTSFDGTSFTDAGNSVQRMFFRFTNGTGTNTRAATTVTYCLRGTATGGTATDANRDYTYPTNYDPVATTTAHDDYNGNCTGRGTFTIAANTSPHYRFPITLHNDNLNEGDETIIFDVVNVVEAGYPSALDAVQDATRTIKDNDAIVVSIANAGTDADDSDDTFQVQEGGNARFTVSFADSDGNATMSAGSITVAYAISGDVVAADYTDTAGGSITIAAGATSGEISIALTQGDADTAAEDLTVTLGAITPGTNAGSASAASSPNDAATQEVTNRVFEHTLRLRRYNADYTTEVTTLPTSYAEDTGAIYFLVDLQGINPTAFASAQTVTWTVTHADTNGTSAADFTHLDRHPRRHQRHLRRRLHRRHHRHPHLPHHRLLGKRRLLPLHRHHRRRQPRRSLQRGLFRGLVGRRRHRRRRHRCRQRQRRAHHHRQRRLHHRHPRRQHPGQRGRFRGGLLNAHDPGRAGSDHGLRPHQQQHRERPDQHRRQHRCGRRIARHRRHGRRRLRRAAHRQRRHHGRHHRGLHRHLPRRLNRGAISAHPHHRRQPERARRDLPFDNFHRQHRRRIQRR